MMTQSLSDDPVRHRDRHRHRELSFLSSDFEAPKLVLVGNPNVGKSLIFGEMSGKYVEVSNYPGTTVEITRGRYGKYELFDSPGIYSVASFSEEECAARDIVLEADIVLNVVDGVHLERDLFLTQQLIDMGKRVVVLVNFMDEVQQQRIEIDFGKLSQFLGVSVYPLTAVAKKGFESLPAAIETAREGVQREELHSSLHTMLSRVGSQAEALLVLEGDAVLAGRHGIAPESSRDPIYVSRRNRVNYIIDHVVTDGSSQFRISDLMGRWSLRPLTGIPILALALFLAYLFVGRFVAQDVVGFTEQVIGRGLWEPWIQGLVAEVIPVGSFLYNVIVGEFGVVSMTTTYLVFLLLPLVAGFYVVLALMEDSGYLPRLATMVDKVLGHLGLNGRAVIPLILGFGCITSATITTRILESRREKTIATAILQFAIPCSAQIAVIAALLAGAGISAILIYSAVIISVLIGLGTVLNRVLPGSPAPLLLDLPPLRLPHIRNVVRKTGIRTYYFMKEAAGWFFVGALAVGITQETGLLAGLQRLLVPLVSGWLQLPPGVAIAFVMGVVRRDFGAAGLYDMQLDPMQVTVALIVITLFVPCIASLMVMMKERGWKEGLGIWIGTWITAFVVGGLVATIVL